MFSTVPTRGDRQTSDNLGANLLLVIAAAVFFGARAIGLAGPGWSMHLLVRGQIAATVFLGIFIEAVPFLLLGTLASGVLQVFARPELIQRLSPRSPFLAALAGVAIGLCFLPVCECGTVPATRRLLAKGAPLPLGIAFLLAAPVVNPVVIVSTSIAFRGQPGMVIGRVALTIAVAVLAGVILGRRGATDVVLSPPDSHDHATHDPGPRPLRLLRHAGGEFLEMARYLVVGALIAAVFQTLVPQEAVLALGQGPILSVFVLMGLAVLLSICSTFDSFVALAFAGSFLPGATLAFLVFGPMIDLKSVLLFDTTFRRRTVAALVGLTATLIAATTIAINLFLA